ncbi:hypothetical protein SDC9_55071 [bioreactor metagenome]|uniref:Uncharacterized protein n=1 Tax=bioreactor metagenome TaxID=1076179 RepID=A0A644WXW8_9ZZZZ
MSSEIDENQERKIRAEPDGKTTLRSAAKSAIERRGLRCQQFHELAREDVDQSQTREQRDCPLPVFDFVFDRDQSHRQVCQRDHRQDIAVLHALDECFADRRKADIQRGGADEYGSNSGNEPECRPAGLLPQGEFRLVLGKQRAEDGQQRQRLGKEVEGHIAVVDKEVQAVDEVRHKIKHEHFEKRRRMMQNVLQLTLNIRARLIRVVQTAGVCGTAQTCSAAIKRNVPPTARRAVRLFAALFLGMNKTSRITAKYPMYFAERMKNADMASSTISFVSMRPSVSSNA